jgi:hypothetical protein
VVFAATGGTTYYFQVGGSAGDSGSLTFHLAVSAVTPPATDNFVSAVNVSSLPYTDSNRATAGATLQPSEQRPCGDPFGATVWYKHTSSGAGVITATTAGSSAGFDTVLAVYTGSSFATLSNLSCDDDSGPGPTSQLAVNVASGTTYYFQAGGFDNATGSLTLGLTFTGSVADSDNDGWSDTAETYIGTNPSLRCGANAWPADIDNDGFVDTGDIGAVTNDFGDAVPGAAPARHDIAPDPPIAPPNAFIDTADVGRLTGLFGLACS